MYCSLEEGLLSLVALGMQLGLREEYSVRVLVGSGLLAWSLDSHLCWAPANPGLEWRSCSEPNCHD